MKEIFLTVESSGQPETNLVILAEKDKLDRLSEILEDNEIEFVRNAARNDIRSFTFFRSGALLLVRLLTKDNHTSAAAEDARLAGAASLAEINNYKLPSVALVDFCETPRVLFFGEGLALAAYQFLKYHSEPNKKKNALSTIFFRNTSPAEVEELHRLVKAVYVARTLVNEPHSFLTTIQFGEEIEKLGEKYGFEVEIFEKEKIEALKMGGLLAVNQAGHQPPLFAILEWKPERPTNAQPVVLVGKGVVYDTGGHSLKTSEGMEYMKSDMGGGAAVVGAFVAAAANHLPVHLMGLIPITDNKIGENGIVPGDVIRMASGKTVEVLNTDAEGRLILADALHYARRYKPALVIDLATLTGAAVRALGQHAICYMGTASKNIKHALENSGMATYERLVEMPLWREYGEEIKSNIADLKNIGGVTAGAITAGKFLEAFTDGYEWLHLDMAGPAFSKTTTGYRTKEGTGAGVRLLYDFLKNWPPLNTN